MTKGPGQPRSGPQLLRHLTTTKQILPPRVALSRTTMGLRSNSNRNIAAVSPACGVSDDR